ncbi:hypothetical protein [Desulfonema magnum]|uniref:Uncharacterized protein n=1 Tax=Desulfonema magnum TaxID=45655 RepID=A0A975BLH9_9BACT|nr:hypothetical protein [Desulfonema magnum]QTA87467.1 Uncharacterized protein dnm_035010 [Desulfonema magnum]
MKKAYLITEGKCEADILRAVLPEEILRRTEFIVGDGRYSAQSLAHSVLAVKQVPTALVLDADTSDSAAVREQLELLKYSLIQASPDTESEVFLAVPEMEILLVQDMDFIMQFTEKKAFSPLEREFARLNPKKFLIKTFSYDNKILKKIISRMDEQTIRRIQNTPLIEQLNDFITSIVN